jgi:DHA1 family multidrug resistance protein-like MFS transporter
MLVSVSASRDDLAGGNGEGSEREWAKPASPAAHAPPAQPVDWRRNLAALWAAEFMAIFAFSLALPFIPLYLHQDLGVRGTHDLALWSGLIGGGTGLSMAVASPIWGTLADRRGRKPMLLRAMLGAAVMVGLMGVAQTAPQLLVLGIAEGSVSGTIAAATALTAAETPRGRVGWAMGALSSAIALGGALAPVVGGFAGAAFGLRSVFLAAGVLLALSSLPVLVIVRESPRPHTREDAARASPGFLSRAVLLMVGVLIVSQALTQFSLFSTEQLAVLHILQVSPVGATVITGAAFCAIGLATSLASITYSRAVKRIGYRWVAVLAALLLAGSIAAVGLAGSVPAILLAVTCFGLCYGSLYPTLAAMLGLRAPREVQATVYGLSGSANAIGMGLGPLVGGAVAAATQVPVALLGTAGVAGVLSLFLATQAREPRTPTA